MNYEEAKECKLHIEMLKSEIEWDKPIGYQIDLDLAIEALELIAKYGGFEKVKEACEKQIPTRIWKEKELSEAEKWSLMS